MAKVSNVSMSQKFAQALQDHQNGILNYNDSRITTVALEGANTKIRVLQRHAHGYRDKEYFKLRIPARHETKFKIAV